MLLLVTALNMQRFRRKHISLIFLVLVMNERESTRLDCLKYTSQRSLFG